MSYMDILIIGIVLYVLIPCYSVTSSVNSRAVFGGGGEGWWWWVGYE